MNSPNVPMAVSTLQSVLDGLPEQLLMLGGAVAWAICWALPVVGLCYVIYYFISLPLRRQERARLFLDLVETGLKRGQSPEQTIVSAAGSEDPTLGARFHLLAAYIEDGLRLEQALEKVPRLLPTQAAAMLRVGSELGDVGRVLPACRKQLKDGVSQTRSGLNFVLVLIFVVMPVFPIMFLFLSTWILPRFEAIYQDMAGGPLPAALWALPLSVRLIGFHLALVLLIQALAVCYVGGPRLRGWLNRAAWLAPLSDKLLWRLPWRRKRMQRDFSLMLALMLDAGVPERRAVQLAAACTDNQAFQRRAEKTGQALLQGSALPAAMEKLDDSGELRWRLENAARGQRGFGAALSGWIEALDAKAFQQEQAAAQFLTTGLVLFNGVMVGLFAVGVFQILTTLVQEVALW